MVYYGTKWYIMVQNVLVLSFKTGDGECPKSALTSSARTRYIRFLQTITVLKKGLSNGTTFM